jgi:hypothetical protein
VVDCPARLNIAPRFNFSIAWRFTRSTLWRAVVFINQEIWRNGAITMRAGEGLGGAVVG